VFLVFCGQTTAASPVCCCVWMRTLAVSTLCIRRARCKRLQSTRRHLSGDLVRNRIGGLTPPGGRHQRHLVVYTQNSSGIKCMPLSGSFGQIGYHYKTQDSAKMCPPVRLLKCHQLQGLRPLTPTGNSAPWTPTGSSAPRPPYRLALPRSP